MIGPYKLEKEKEKNRILISVRKKIIRKNLLGKYHFKIFKCILQQLTMFT